MSIFGIAVLAVAFLFYPGNLVWGAEVDGACADINKAPYDFLACQIRNIPDFDNVIRTAEKRISVETTPLSPDGLRLVAREIARKYTIYDAFRFLKCVSFQGQWCSGPIEMKHRPAPEVFVGIYVELMTEFRWTLGEVFGLRRSLDANYPDERAFWQSAADGSIRLTQSSSLPDLAKHVCVVLTGSFTCKEKLALMPLFHSVKPTQPAPSGGSAGSYLELPHSVQKDWVFRDRFSRFAGRFGEQFLLQQELLSAEGQAQSAEDRAIRLQWLARIWSPQNMQAAKLAVEISAGRPEMTSQYSGQLAQLDTDTRNYLDPGHRRYSYAARNIMTFGLYRLGFWGPFREFAAVGTPTGSAGSADFYDAFSILKLRRSPLSGEDQQLIRLAASKLLFPNDRQRKEIGSITAPGLKALSAEIAEPNRDQIVFVPLREGDRLIEGTLKSGTAQADFAIVTCQSGSKPTEFLGSRYLGGQSSIFSIPLRRELRAEECVKFRAGNNTYQPVQVQTASNSWGRVRLYGRGGMEIFGRGLDAHVAPIGALTFDYALRSITTDLLRKERLPIGFHFFMEGRIESVSVTAQLKEGYRPDTNGKKIGSRCGRDFTCSGPPFDGQAGEIGMYAPIGLPLSRIGPLPLRWNYRGSQMGVFLAPIVKVGTMGRYRPPMDGEIKYQYKDEILIGKELRAGPYSYRAAGLRLGSMRYFGDTSKSDHNLLGKIFLGNTAPISGWNLDLMAGRWQTFSLPNHNVLPWRFELRGTVQIPSTPWFVGGFSNIGAGPNDYRFFFGMRGEFAQMVSRMRWAKKRSRPCCVGIEGAIDKITTTCAPC